MNAIFCLFVILVGVMLKTLKSLYILKSTPMKAAVISSFIQVVNVVSIKFIIDYTTWWAVMALVLINVIGVYVVMHFFEHNLNKKTQKPNNQEINDLTDAIDHCDAVANSHKCDACGDSHRQLGNWLRELRGLKKNAKS